MLEINKFSKIIVANWKLNGSKDFIDRFYEYFDSNMVKDDELCAVICPPTAFLENCYKEGSLFKIGAQNCSNFESGAYTGEISAPMLKDKDCTFCLVGHSERRQIFGETNKDIFLKIENLINSDINPIVCVGETLNEKKQGQTNQILKEQITKSLPKHSSKNSIILAYEPIWAIGSGLTPSLEEIDKIHYFIKNEIKGFENFKILYGGSVKSSNSKDILNLKNVDGLLVGGASLEAIEFIKILKS